MSRTASTAPPGNNRFPADGRVEYRWPGHTWPQSFERFVESTHLQAYAEPAGAG